MAEPPTAMIAGTSTGLTALEPLQGSSPMMPLNPGTVLSRKSGTAVTTMSPAAIACEIVSSYVVSTALGPTDKLMTCGPFQWNRSVLMMYCTAAIRDPVFPGLSQDWLKLPLPSTINPATLTSFATP